MAFFKDIKNKAIKEKPSLPKVTEELNIKTTVNLLENLRTMNLMDKELFIIQKI